MTGVHNGVLVQRPQLGVYGTSEQVKITAGVGDIGSADGTRKERITDEDMVGAVLDLNQQATPTEGVSGCVQHTQFKGAKAVCFACFKGLVSDGRFWQCKAIAPAGGLGERLEKIVIRMKVPFNAVMFP